MSRTNPYSPPGLAPGASRSLSASAAALTGLLLATAVVSVFRAGSIFMPSFDGTSSR